MKTITTYLTIFALVTSNCRAEPNRRAVINDPDGYTNIRADSRGNSDIVARVNEGEEFLAEPSDATWWRVTGPRGDSGYMHRSRVSLLPASDPPQADSPADRTDSQPDTQKYYVVNVGDYDTLNVRSGPGVKHSIIAKFPNGIAGIQIQGVPVLNGNDDWVHITFADGEGWIRPQYLAAIRVPTARPSSRVGFVISPFSGELLDVRGLPKQCICNDPTATGRQFYHDALAGGGEQSDAKPEMTTGEKVLGVAAVAAGAYLLYKLFSPDSSSSTSDRNEAAERQQREDDMRERVLMQRREADERAVREGKPKPYGY